VSTDIISLQLYRARKARDNYTTPEQPIVWWKCREFSCIAKVGITQTALDALAVFQAELARRRDRPLREDEIGWCCDDHRVVTSRPRARREVDDTAAYVPAPDSRQPKEDDDD
jgi:hypothetical protein